MDTTMIYILVTFLGTAISHDFVWGMIVLLILFWKRMKGAAIRLIEIEDKDGTATCTEQHDIWQSKGEYQFRTNKADVIKVFKKGIFRGKGDKIELKHGNYHIFPGKVPKYTVILKGLNGWKDAAQFKIKKLEEQIIFIEDENNEMKIELNRLRRRFNFDVSTRVKEILDGVKEVQPFMNLKKTK